MLVVFFFLCENRNKEGREVEKEGKKEEGGRGKIRKDKKIYF